MPTTQNATQATSKLLTKLWLLPERQQRRRHSGADRRRRRARDLCQLVQRGGYHWSAAAGEQLLGHVVQRGGACVRNGRWDGPGRSGPCAAPSGCLRYDLGEGTERLGCLLRGADVGAAAPDGLHLPALLPLLNACHDVLIYIWVLLARASMKHAAPVRC